MTIFSGANGVDPFDPTSGLTPLIYDIGHTIASPAVVGDILLVESSGSSIISCGVSFLAGYWALTAYRT
jgi:hypothetical protein